VKKRIFEKHLAPFPRSFLRRAKQEGRNGTLFDEAHLSTIGELVTFYICHLLTLFFPQKQCRRVILNVEIPLLIVPGWMNDNRMKVNNK
jgi:hypothetical protein